MQKLRDFLDKHNISQARFAKLVGISQTTLSDILRNKHYPSIEIAWAIENQTYGEVKMKDWLTPEDLVACHTNNARKKNKAK